MSEIVIRRRFTVVDVVVELAGPTALQQLFASLYADAVAASAEVTPDLRVQVRMPGFHVHIDGESVGAAGSLHEGYELLQQELTYALLRSLSPRHLLVHAGAILVPQACLLMPGNHDSGKSSLTYALARRGRFFSDDVTPVDPISLRARPFERELVLHRGTRSRYPDLPQVEGCTHFPDYDYLPGRRAGLRWADPAPVTGLVFPRRQEGSQPQLVDVTSAESARRILEQCFDLQALGPASADTVADLARLPAVEAIFHDAEQVAEGLIDWAT